MFLLQLTPEYTIRKQRVVERFLRSACDTTADELLDQSEVAFHQGEIQVITLTHFLKIF